MLVKCWWFYMLQLDSPFVRNNFRLSITRSHFIHNTTMTNVQASLRDLITQLTELNIWSRLYKTLNHCFVVK